MSRQGRSDFQVAHGDGSPLYLQLARTLAEAIHGGHYQTDQALPSERVLAESLQVSRVTARKAIDQLVGQGLVVRRHGSGNYVAPRGEPLQARLSSLSEQIAQRGFQPSTRWLDRGITDAAPEERLGLALPPGTRVARLERLRLADNVVMAYELSVLPQSVLPEPQQVADSLYAHLERIGKGPVRALQRIRALNASPRLAEQLCIAVGQALLFITRTSYLASGQPVELTQAYCRSDYYDVVVESRRAS